MNNLNIPIYRAKKIGSNECAEGFLIKKNYDNQKVRYFILEDKNTEVAMTYEIDPTTLAINLPDMLDSQGNKIFASLSKDGKGGDILESKGHNIECSCSFCKPIACSYVDNNFTFTSCDDCKNKKNETYQEICSNCKRFYGCYFEAKEKLC